MPPSVRLQNDAQSVLDEMAEDLALDAKPTNDEVWTGLYRAQLHEFRRFAGQAVEMREVRPVNVAYQGHRFALRVYKPLKLRIGTGVLYFHGGGFIAGSLDTHDRLARSLAESSGSAVFALDYPLAPEAPFPVAAERCFAAYRWLRDNAAELDLEPKHLVVVGDSVGGLFAAVVAILCRDRHVSPPALQVSLYPNMDLRLERHYPSMDEFDGIIVKLAELNRGLAHYVPNDADREDPRASPLACGDFRRLAPAWVLTCECDPLRDEGRLWAQRLKDAGVQVTHREAKQLPHAFLQMGGRVAAARAMFEEIGAAITAVAGTDASPSDSHKV